MSDDCIMNYHIKQTSMIEIYGLFIFTDFNYTPKNYTLKMAQKCFSLGILIKLK